MDSEALNEKVLPAKDLLKKLCDLPCLSGYETGSPVAEIITAEFARYCDEVRTDKTGNIVALKKGKPDGIKIMFAAHMDEIGLMVSGVDKRGMVKFTTLGGFDQRTLVCQEVIIHAKEDIFGVIGVIPPHLADPSKADKAIRMEDLGIDTGYEKDDIEKLVKPGDRISIRRKSADLQGDFVTGKSMDDIAGVVSLREAMRKLKDFNHDANVYFVATVREETAAHGGALIAAYDAEPDIAVAVDVGFGKTPELSEQESVEMGKGAAVAIGPNMNKNVFERFKKAAKENGVPHQIEVIHLGSSGTDAYSMQIARSGAASGLLSIPLRYMHTSVETVRMDDINAAARLMQAFVMDFNDSTFEAF